MEKKIDEKWKEEVEKETKEAGKEEPSLKKEADFSTFLSSLFIEALVCLGEMPNPVSKQKEENLEQAKYLIDILTILQGKTKGNLNPEETTMLENILYELRMKYISKAK